MRTGEAFDWKSYSGKLNERQEKLKEKLHKKDQTVQNLRAEIQRIQAKKDAQEGGLSQGQEMQVARNEQRIEQLEEEMDMLGAWRPVREEDPPKISTDFESCTPPRLA